MMKTTLLQDYASTLADNLIRKTKTFGAMRHKPTMGTVRELFVHEFLTYFLPDHLGIGTGVIINQAGHQSRQTDIVIFDKRLFPPILGKQTVGVYPIQSVIGAIEVKSSCSIGLLGNSDSDFHYLRNTIFHKKYQYRDMDEFEIMTGFIVFNPKGFDSKKFKILNADKDFRNLNAICVEGKFSVLKYKVKNNGVKENQWHYAEHSIADHEELKRFVCWFTDLLIFKANNRIQGLAGKFRSWTSIYFRKQFQINRHFENIDKVSGEFNY